VKFTLVPTLRGDVLGETHSADDGAVRGPHRTEPLPIDPAPVMHIRAGLTAGQSSPVQRFDDGNDLRCEHLINRVAFQRLR
jgi:hypothetical protein